MKTLKVYFQDFQEKIMDNLPWKSVMHFVMWTILGIGSFYVACLVLKVMMVLLNFLFS
jgi:hypothetical protein